jgi:hypothetical protein
MGASGDEFYGEIAFRISGVPPTILTHSIVFLSECC